MARKIELNGQNQIVIVTREEISISTDKISVDSIVDTGESVIARVSFFSMTGYTKELVLWEGQSYIDIGQWTDSDADLRIKELLKVS